jgi:predicted amidohydrolase
VGEENGLPFSGGSMALDPDPRVLAEAGSEEERIVTAEIGAPGRRDPRTHYPELLRDELYRASGITAQASGRSDR